MDYNYSPKQNPSDLARDIGVPRSVCNLVLDNKAGWAAEIAAIRMVDDIRRDPGSIIELIHGSRIYGNEEKRPD